MCGLQLNGLAHEERPRPKAVKSSLKGSSSQLSLEEVAAAARRNAAQEAYKEGGGYSVEKPAEHC